MLTCRSREVEGSGGLLTRCSHMLTHAQGTWMGLMFSIGAVARVAGPFWAVTGYYYIGSFAVFGSTALLYLLSLVFLKLLWPQLAPAPEPTPQGARVVYTI
jgi:hypothetical protein